MHFSQNGDYKYLSNYKNEKLDPGQGTQRTSPLHPCPQCESKKVWRDGHRTPMFGQPIQRWSCRDCSYKFSDPIDVENGRKAFQKAKNIESMNLKSDLNIATTCQICVDNKETKNLVAEQTTTLVVPQKREYDAQDLKGAVVEFLWFMQKEGRAKDTYEPYCYSLEFLIKNGANLFDPESVKKLLANLDKTKARKYNLLKAYRAFLNAYGIKPSYLNTTQIGRYRIFRLKNT